jgi:hypothetical protein
MAPAGAGAAQVALPLASSGHASAATLTTDAAATAPVPRMLNGGRYPIGMWWPPHPFESNHDTAAQVVRTPGADVSRVVMDPRPGRRPPFETNGRVRLTLPPGAFALVTLRKG